MEQETEAGKYVFWASHNTSQHLGPPQVWPLLQQVARWNKFEAFTPNERLNAAVNSALCVSSKIVKRSINVPQICGMQAGTSSQLQMPFINQLASHWPTGPSDPRGARLRSEERKTGTMGANASPPPAAKCASQNAYYDFYTYIYIEREIDTVDSAGHLVDKSPNCISTHFLSGLLWSLTGYDSMSIGAINLQHWRHIHCAVILAKFQPILQNHWGLQ